MNKITLSTSLDDFVLLLSKNLVHEFLPDITARKNYNTYFLFLCVCNHKKINDLETYKKFNVWYDRGDPKIKKYKILSGSGGFSRLIRNDSNNILSENSSEKEAIKSKDGAIKFAKKIVGKCQDLNSLIKTIETSQDLNEKFIKYVTEKIKPIFEIERSIRDEEFDVQTIHESTVYKKIKQLIDADNKQLVLTGPPGTGKTYIAQQLAERLGEATNFNNFIQFHPSYDYVDFIEGIRPFENQKQEMVFKKTDGTFKNFCRKVAELNAVSDENQSKKYFFIIDEINRADLSKVFGELLFALEEDKRGKQISTQYAQLPTYYYNDEDKDTVMYESDVFTEGFFVPENIIILATMNDIDRSVEHIDLAFRRRFKWIQVHVDENLLREAFMSGEFMDERFVEDVIQAIHELNQHIKLQGNEFQLNENYFISQGYFKNLKNQNFSSSRELLEHVWDVRIGLTIAEYVRGESTADDFLQTAREVFTMNPKSEQ
ncbi:McrB family protein [Exiguobacterium undae]